MTLFNVDNNNMDFKGNPIYGGNLSKKYLKFIKKNPEAPIPSKLLNKTSLKKGVFKLLKRYSDKGFSIINNKLTKWTGGDINEFYDSDKYDLGMYFPMVNLILQKKKTLKDLVLILMIFYIIN